MTKNTIPTKAFPFQAFGHNLTEHIMRIKIGLSEISKPAIHLKDLRFLRGLFPVALNRNFIPVCLYMPLSSISSSPCILPHIQPEERSSYSDQL